MADMSIDSLLNSKPFRFIVGPEKKEFMMHSTIVAKISKPFDTLVNGSMKEAREGVAHLSEIDEATFTYFFQWAYKGDYEIAHIKFTVPRVCDNPNHKNCTHCHRSINQCRYCNKDRDHCGCEHIRTCDYCGYCPCRCTQDDTKRERGALDNFGTDGSKVMELWKTFVRESRIPLSSLYTLGIDESLEGSWSDVLLAHARVYVLADYYHIDQLAELAEQKLHQTLVFFELNQSNADAISALVEYVCRNTVDRYESPNTLRVLLYRYCACNIQQLSRNERFKGLLQEMGDLSEAIIQRMLERLC